MTVITQWLRFKALAVVLLFLSGCAVVINQPVDQAMVAAPGVRVDVTLPGLYRPGTFKAQLNEADVTSQFSVSQQNGTANANLTLTPGTYALDVSACWGINIVFVQQPPFPFQGCSGARANFSVVQARLILSPANLTVAVGTSGTAAVQAVPAPPAALTITLSSAPASRITVPASVTVPANTSTGVNIAVQGVAPGSPTLSASATGYTPATLSVSVPPRVAQLSPATGPPGTTVTVTGAGFVAPVTARFGTTSAPVTVISSGQLSVPVPAGLAAGVRPFTITSGGQTSAAVNFTVTAAPATNVTALFRATNDRIEIIQFTQQTPFSSSTFQLLGSVNTSASPGMLAVGLCRDGARLAWTGSGNAHLFSIGGTPTSPTLTQTAATPLPTTLTGNGTACAFLSTAPAALVRATDMGVEALSTAANPLTKSGGFNGALASSGVSMIAAAPRFWRSYPAGIEEYALNAAGVPNRVANVTSNMTASTTGTAVAWLAAGTTLIRATNVGIDVIGVTATPMRLGFLNSGGASATGVGVSVAGTRVVRATNLGIETYDLSTPAAPVRCAFRNAGGSATGVGVVAIGTVAFRVTNVSIEAYDISDTSCPVPVSSTIIPPPVQLQTGLGTSATGVAVIAR